MKINGFTPRQFAYDLAAGWISAAYQQRTGDLQDLTESQMNEVKQHLARLYSKVLNDAGLDGLPLSDRA